MYVEIWSLELVRLRKNSRKLLGSLLRFKPMASSSVTTVELPGAYLTVSQLTHSMLKHFFWKFLSHNYFDDASVDSNSETII